MQCDNVIDLKEESVLFFGTKAENLLRLSRIIKNAEILPLLYFTVLEWRKSKEKILKKLSEEYWLAKRLVVRSSAIEEDGIEQSCAGKYLSVNNVLGLPDIESAIERVIISYSSENELNQVLIQPQLINVKISGVSFSYDPNTCSPYIIINYDDSSGMTDSVTSGRTSELKIYIHHHQSIFVNKILFINKVISLINELMVVYSTKFLDIEFAVDRDDKLYLLQVRPLIIDQQDIINIGSHSLLVREIANKIKTSMRPHPYLLGKKTIYGVMPDWNPAEIIGIRPKPLALSLYRELITDSIWAYQRDNYGYRNLRGFPLLIDYLGLPYIDVRVSFNSFIPKSLSENLASRLIDYYILKLIKAPSLHDKVEFEIIFSCYTFDLSDRLNVLKEYGLTVQDRNEVFSSLVSLTKGIIDNKSGLWKEDLKKISRLEERRNILYASNLDKISKMYWLLEDCKRYGTLPFAGLARAGFIAIQILNSMVNVGILSQEQSHAFLLSTNTITSQMQGDLYRLSRERFLEKYGHLRPGTYDVLSPRYDDAPDTYFNWDKINKEKGSTMNEKKESFSLSLSQLKMIRSCLQKDQLDVDVIDLIYFMKSAIEAREYAKFIFTKNVSDFLKLLVEFCQEYSLEKDNVAFLDVKNLLSLYSTSRNVSSILLNSIEVGKKQYRETRSINLPPVITDENNAWSFGFSESQPNYITQKSYQGKVIHDLKSTLDLSGMIVMIESADPGYDWIFSHKIGAFITMYGGINSHMAIRAGETGVPAVIGVGSLLYSKLVKAHFLSIDCGNKKITDLSCM